MEIPTTTTDAKDVIEKLKARGGNGILGLGR
jgi:hypothetical protein